MMRSCSLLWALCAAWTAFFVTALASAAAPDPRAVQNRLEEQLLEGEIDAEDYLRWHLAPSVPTGPARGAAYLGVEAFRVERKAGSTEIGAMLVIELPLERFTFPRALNGPLSASLIAPAPALGREAGNGAEGIVFRETTGASDLGSGAGTGLVPGALLDEAAPNTPPVSPNAWRSGIAESAPPRAGNAATVPAIVVTTDVARSCVRAALRAAGLGDDHRLESVAARARSSAALPELRLRAVRTLGESGRISLSEDDPSRYVASGAATNVLEARLTFRLDRLLFADEEIVVERARLDRSEQRLRITGKVLQTLFEWQKAYALLQDPSLPSEDRLSAALREAETTAVLDMMTGGWFGAYRAALAARGP